MKLQPWTPPAGLATDLPYVVEYYYKVRWGHAEEFLELFLRNHYPVLEKQLETGRVRDVRIEQPRLHGTEAERWDYRVTLVFANVIAAHDKTHEPMVIRALYPDQERFAREEAHRFGLLLAHWDLPVVGIRPG
ncbi:MAG: hypothetical protein QY320_13580 [Gammaproteobacteria bacterium]|nr:MAG: hypothetical protein QY320_13580 [Gammaproteobacteria bacterium]